MRSHGRVLGLVPYDLRPPTLARARKRLWNVRDGRFLVPTLFGVGWAVNLSNTPRHPLQALLFVALIAWRIRAGRNPELGL